MHVAFKELKTYSMCYIYAAYHFVFKFTNSAAFGYNWFCEKILAPKKFEIKLQRRVYLPQDNSFIGVAPLVQFS